MDLKPGSRVGAYEIEALIGAGGIGTAHQVRHVDLGSRHTLKLLRSREQVESWAGSEPGLFERLEARLLQEGRILARLRHPNVVGATDTVRVDGRLGLVVDRVVGPTLKRHLQLRGTVSVSEADALAAGLCAAVDHVHQHGIVHRSLMPGNVLLDTENGPTWTPRVVDFGLALVLGGSELVERKPDLALGIPGFMAPEQTLDSDAVDVRADVYGVAATLWTALTGVRVLEPPPLDSTASMAEIRARLQPYFARLRAGERGDARALRPGLPDRIVDALERALAADPGERTPDVATFLAEWQQGASAGFFPAPKAPVGDVTLVFTDIQGSTELWDRDPTLMRRVLRAHNTLVRAALLDHGGFEVKTEGDSFMVAFDDPRRAVDFCCDVQRALYQQPWPEEMPENARGGQDPLVRMGVHTGRPDVAPDPRTGHTDYLGPAANLAARVEGAAHGGQILLSGATVAALGDRDGSAPVGLGSFRLKGIREPVELFELRPEGHPRTEFPPPRVS